ncbi:hypothetical protein [Marininema halotolerans]|uniref:Uncharacterized protein n=1 Tax=Marininema halotolerans TaxID=1155944 RepID=A0A1I6TMS8_9BACL|nr:hypothetical protein [Marininema halotolerans]SFS90430.1 hypothetical protein SAMN05444972_110140 [Marininema halotolerans]
MDWILNLITPQGWTWFLAIFFIAIVLVTFASMVLTEKIERRHKQEFEQEFTGRFEPVTAEKDS